jgi:hypothetical protein
MTPETQEKIDALRKLAADADEDDRRSRMIQGAIGLIVTRLVALVPGAAEDPFVKVAMDSLNEVPGAAEQLMALYKRRIDQMKGQTS